MIIYDFEVFKEDWLVVFLDAGSKSETIIVNDRDKLCRYYEEHKNDIFIGYNSNHYDQYIFKGILLDMDPYKISKFIISGEQGYRYSREFSKIRLLDYDCSIQFKSLKQLEGYMGLDIIESNVSFNLTRKLTDNELRETIEYCRADVRATMEVFINTSSEFKSKLDLIKEFQQPIEYISRTNQQITSYVLGASSQYYGDEFDFEISNNINVGRHQAIKGWYEDSNNMDYNCKLEYDIAGVPHTFRWGGIHGAIKNYVDEGIFVLADVGSYYPSLMIRYGYESRSISKKNKYKEIYDARFELKKAGNPKQGVYKLVLNGTYGCMKYPYNGLYDPRQANNVCVNGQLLLVDLIDKLEDDYKLIQSNTDGIMFKLDSIDQLEDFKKVCRDWEVRTNLDLSYDIFHKIIQKDVNNYLAINYNYSDINSDDEYNYIKSSKYLVGKGAWLKNLSSMDYDLPVVNKAIKAYFIDNIDPVEYITNENRLIEFQQIVKVSGNYKYAKHNGKLYSNQKVFRVFASKHPLDSGIFKLKTYIRPEKFEDTPTNCFIDNGDVRNKIVPDKLDKSFYIRMAKQRIEGIEGSKINQLNLWGSRQ